MGEGKILQIFIDNQRLSKTKIAEDLGMSRRNLYQLFESQTLEEDTKERFEIYFEQEIFTKEAIEEIGKQNFYKIAAEIKSKKEQSIDELNARIKSLERDKDFIHETYGEKLKLLQQSLDASLKNQQLLQAQVSVAFHLLVEQLVDPKKSDAILNEFDKLTFADRQ